MLEDYLNQTAILSKFVSMSEYAEMTYTTSTIVCRKDSNNKLIKKPDGVDVVCDTMVITKTPVTVKDLVDGRTVASVKTPALLDGSISHYEVYLL